MKVEVTLYQAGNTWKEVVVLSRFEDAKKTALSINPTARVMAQNPVF